ncbi:MAG: hypothetical protein WBQ69_05910 [Gallionella sp.]
METSDKLAIQLLSEQVAVLKGMIEANIRDTQSLSRKMYSSHSNFSASRPDLSELPDEISMMDFTRQIAVECQTMVNKKEAPNLIEAQKLLFMRDPKLGRRYVECSRAEAE